MISKLSLNMVRWSPLAKPKPKIVTVIKRETKLVGMEEVEDTEKTTRNSCPSLADRDNKGRDMGREHLINHVLCSQRARACRLH